MSIFADSRGKLTVHHEILCVEGIRYLLQPIRDVSFTRHSLCQERPLSQQSWY